MLDFTWPNRISPSISGGEWASRMGTLLNELVHVRRSPETTPEPLGMLIQTGDKLWSSKNLRIFWVGFRGFHWILIDSDESAVSWMPGPVDASGSRSRCRDLCAEMFRNHPISTVSSPEQPYDTAGHLRTAVQKHEIFEIPWKSSKILDLGA